MGRYVSVPHTVNGEWLMAMAQASANASNTVNALCEDSAAMTLIFNNPTLMATIGNSGTVFTAISGSTNSVTIGKWIAFKAGLNPADYADMDAVVASSTAMTAVVASSTAMNAVVASSTAMTVINANDQALRIWMLAGTNQVYSNFANVAAVAASSTAMTAVAASSTAMTAVIASSTAMTAVVASSTACAAIKASSTAITALDSSSPITVPTMSSNTDPSGVATDSVSSENAYVCFDGNGITFDDISGSANNWIRYQFSAAVWCYKFSIQSNRSSYFDRQTKNFKVQYSSDGSTWNDALVGSTSAGDGSNQTFNVCAASGKVAYWRVYNVLTWGGVVFAPTTVQFYCK